MYGRFYFGFILFCFVFLPSNRFHIGCQIFLWFKKMLLFVFYFFVSLNLYSYFICGFFMGSSFVCFLTTCTLALLSFPWINCHQLSSQSASPLHFQLFLSFTLQNNLLYSFLALLNFFFHFADILFVC